ncbi:unnamed protein product [Bursaphelenchus okinawaensis]|uniref:Uncharacterized protein n=1 Tax=Bursaphelenchus okinawaensis TaxID=465554 RepID=A0A811KIA9_9BILA|nr:unnamed protein product [Bursaphelenchus okinawaensis]CAG9105186.1 unnamed protein product [Bursaphelenchus okinawaensis]
MAFYTEPMNLCERFLNWFREWIEIWHIWVVSIGTLLVMTVVCLVALFNESTCDDGRVCDKFFRRVQIVATEVTKDKVSYGIMAFLGVVFVFPFLVLFISLRVIGPYERKNAVRENRIFSLF